MYQVGSEHTLLISTPHAASVAPLFSRAILVGLGQANFIRDKRCLLVDGPFWTCRVLSEIQIVLHLNFAVQITSVYNPGLKLRSSNLVSKEVHPGQVLPEWLYERGVRTRSWTGPPRGGTGRNWRLWRARPGPGPHRWCAVLKIASRPSPWQAESSDEGALTLFVSVAFLVGTSSKAQRYIQLCGADIHQQQYIISAVVLCSRSPLAPRRRNHPTKGPCHNAEYGTRSLLY